MRNFYFEDFTFQKTPKSGKWLIKWGWSSGEENKSKMWIHLSAFVFWEANLKEMEVKLNFHAQKNFGTILWASWINYFIFWENIKKLKRIPTILRESGRSQFSWIFNEEITLRFSAFNWGIFLCLRDFL